MKVRLKVFAAAKEAVGEGHVDLELAEAARVSDLKAALVECFPELEALVGRSAFAIDQQYAADDDAIPEFSEVAMIPPVSGG
jgi:molybdopterin converting factor small subunit